MTGFGQSCGACKFLRRKCTSECVFAPYFCYDGAANHFSAVHKVFGASNVSKLLLHLPIPNRSDAATTISFEALARMRDPIYGCVAHIFALQQQVAYLQEEIGVLGNQIASNFTFGVESSESSEATNTNYCNSNLEPQVINPQLDVTNNNNNNNNISQSQIMMLSSSSSSLSSSSENSNYLSIDFNGQALFDDDIHQLPPFIGLEEENNNNNNNNNNNMICTDHQSLLEPLGLELEGLFYEIEQVNFGNTLWLEDINNPINVPNCVAPIWD